MTTGDLINNMKTLIDTQHVLNNDASKALKTAWYMSMNMGRQHGFSDVICHECWCKAMQSHENSIVNKP